MVKRREFYLLYKEALNNIVKHANVKQVWVNLDFNSPYVMLTVRDDGVGQPLHVRIGNGIGNMHARSAKLKGTPGIISLPGRGMTVQLTFPA